MSGDPSLMMPKISRHVLTAVNLCL